MIKDIASLKEGTFELTWHDSTDFSKIKPILQVYGICFNSNGKIVLINTNGKWCLPGGTPEKEESFEETLIREVDEEASVDIKRVFPLGYQKVLNMKDNSIIYQLRYAALISKVNKPKIDVATRVIPKRKFISPSNFLEYCKWGNTGKAIIEKAVKWFNSQKR
jgi:8-oxo-dGTP pyrophosphatase MutT (NUDIX family)